MSSASHECGSVTCEWKRESTNRVKGTRFQTCGAWFRHWANRAPDSVVSAAINLREAVRHSRAQHVHAPDMTGRALLADLLDRDQSSLATHLNGEIEPSLPESYGGGGAEPMRRHSRAIDPRDQAFHGLEPGLLDPQREGPVRRLVQRQDRRGAERPGTGVVRTGRSCCDHGQVPRRIESDGRPLSVLRDVSAPGLGAYHVRSVIEVLARIECQREGRVRHCDVLMLC